MERRNGKPHKTLTTWAQQAIRQTKRWLPDRRLIFVTDSGFATLDLLAAVRCHVCVIIRLRLDDPSTDFDEKIAIRHAPSPTGREIQTDLAQLQGTNVGFGPSRNITWRDSDEPGQDLDGSNSLR
jgi:hypothetical protein